MKQILEWLKRIIEIGIWEFLRKLGWKALAGVLMAVVALLGLVILLVLIIIALLF